MEMSTIRYIGVVQISDDGLAATPIAENNQPVCWQSFTDQSPNFLNRSFTSLK